MKISIYTSLIVLTIFCIIATTACNKKKSDQINQPQSTAAVDYNSITECHKKENPLPSQITANIEGIWVWEKKACFWSGQQTFTADKHVVVQFNDGGLYKVTENGKTISEGTWNLSNTGDDFWTLKCTNATHYLQGKILLCKDELVLHSSYIDGCDLYYKRR